MLKKFVKSFELYHQDRSCWINSTLKFTHTCIAKTAQNEAQKKEKKKQKKKSNEVFNSR